MPFSDSLPSAGFHAGAFPLHLVFGRGTSTEVFRYMVPVGVGGLSSSSRWESRSYLRSLSGGTLEFSARVVPSYLRPARLQRSTLKADDSRWIPAAQGVRSLFRQVVTAILAFPQHRLLFGVFHLHASNKRSLLLHSRTQPHPRHAQAEHAEQRRLILCSRYAL
jgi:hypothetical protein